MVVELRAEQVTNSITWHGEGPTSLDGGSTFAWLDMLAGDVLVREFPDGAIDRYAVHPDVVSVVRPRLAGGLVVTTETDVVLYPDGLAGPSSLLVTLPLPEGVRLNDGGCDALGRLWIGSMAYDVTPGAGELYVVDEGGSFESVLTGLTISNGLAFTADGSEAFFIDSTTLAVDRLVLGDDGSVASREVWATIEEGTGLPDGLTLDDTGGVWVSLFGGGAVLRFDANGELDTIVRLPVSQPTACSFLGTSGRLLITTSRYGLDDDAEPPAGSLFAVDTPHRGFAPHPFGTR